MNDCLLLQPNLLTIVPGSINIENFIPGRVYKETLTIYNTCKIPIIVNLRASDKSKLILNKTLLRIEVNDHKKVDLVIQDKINYSSKKLPTTPKKLYIHINGELIEEKYEINLMYFCNNNTYRQKQLNPEKEIPSVYLAQYQNTYNDIKNNRRFLIDKTCNIFIRRYENNLVASLKNQINNLMLQISKMQKSDKKINYISPQNYTKSNNSFFIISNKIDDPKGKFKIDENINTNAIIAKNKILEVENSVLAERIKKLEENMAKNGYFMDKNEIKDYKYNTNGPKNMNYYIKNNNINNNDIGNDNDNDDIDDENNNVENYNNNYNDDMNNNYNDNMNNNFNDNIYNNFNDNNNEFNDNEYNELSDEQQEYQFQDDRKDMEINDNQNFENNEF